MESAVISQNAGDFMIDFEVRRCITVKEANDMSLLQLQQCPPCDITPLILSFIYSFYFIFSTILLDIVMPN